MENKEEYWKQKYDELKIKYDILIEEKTGFKNNQNDNIERLHELASELSKKKTNKKEAIASLNEAGILTKKGKFTKQYKSLEEI